MRGCLIPPHIFRSSRLSQTCLRVWMNSCLPGNWITVIISGVTVQASRPPLNTLMGIKMSELASSKHDLCICYKRRCYLERKTFKWSFYEVNVILIASGRLFFSVCQKQNAFKGDNYFILENKSEKWKDQQIRCWFNSKIIRFVVELHCYSGQHGYSSTTLHNKTRSAGKIWVKLVYFAVISK